MFILFITYGWIDLQAPLSLQDDGRLQMSAESLGQQADQSAGSHDEIGDLWGRKGVEGD